MITTAEITLKGGRIVYQTVMFPNCPRWADEILENPKVVKVRQIAGHV